MFWDGFWDLLHMLWRDEVIVCWETARTAAFEEDVVCDVGKLGWGEFCRMMGLLEKFWLRGVSCIAC